MAGVSEPHFHRVCSSHDLPSITKPYRLLQGPVLTGFKVAGGGDAPQQLLWRFTQPTGKPWGSMGWGRQRGGVHRPGEPRALTAPLQDPPGPRKQAVISVPRTHHIQVGLPHQSSFTIRKAPRAMSRHS